MTASRLSSVFSGALLVALVGLTGLLNFGFTPLVYLISPSDDSALFLAPLAGFMVAEVAALALWLVWSPRTLGPRLAVHWLAALFLYGCWLGGIAVVGRLQTYAWEDLTQAALSVGIVLPLTSLAVQAPLWLCRAVFGWRLDRFSAGADAAPERKLSIGDLLIGTTAVAASLGSLRLAPFVNESIDGEFWLGVGVGGLTIALLSAMLLIPLTLAVLRPATHRFAALFTLLFAAAVLLVQEAPVALVAVNAGAGLDDFGPILLLIAAFFGGFVLGLAAPLWIARWQGCRLRFRRECRLASPPSESPFASAPLEPQNG